MRWAPHVTVAAIVEQQNKFLIVEENTSSGVRFNQPAGHLEANESIIDAVIRETLEETAWIVQPEFLTGIYQWTSNSNSVSYLRFCFYASRVSQNSALPLDEGIIQAIWLSKQELLNNQHKCRSPLVIQCINDYLAGQSYPLSALHNVIAEA